MPNKAVRPSRDDVMPALALNAHYGGEKAILTHRPKGQRHPGGEQNERDHLQRDRHTVGPMESPQVQSHQDPLPKDERKEQRTHLAVFAAWPWMHPFF